jgi:hypothetical protein
MSMTLLIRIGSRVRTKRVRVRLALRIRCSKVREEGRGGRSRGEAQAAGLEDTLSLNHLSMANCNSAVVDRIVTDL